VPCRVAAVDAVSSAVLRSLSSHARSGHIRPSARAETTNSSRPPTAPALQLEELLSHILSFALDLSHDELIAQAHPPSRLSGSRPAVLAVCRRWNRVATPLLFRCVVLRRVRDVTAFMHAVAVRTSEEDDAEPSSAPALVPQSSSPPGLSFTFARHVRKLVLLEGALAPGGAELVQYTLARMPNLEHLYVNLWNTPPFVVSAALETTATRTTHILDAHRFNPLGIQWAFARWRDFLRARLQDARDTQDADTETDPDLDGSDSEDDDDMSTSVDSDVRPSRVSTYMAPHPIDDLLDGIPTRASFTCRPLDGYTKASLHLSMSIVPAEPLLVPPPAPDVCPHRALIWFSPVEHPGPFGDWAGFVQGQHWPSVYTVDDFGPLRMTLSFDTGGRPPLHLS